MRVITVAGALSLLLLSACAAPSEDVGSRTEWIVDGELDHTPQVVYLINRWSGGACTGSIIAPRVVLTAKHCVQQDNAAEPDPPQAFLIGIGDSNRRLTDTYGAIEVVTTPGSYDSRLRGLIGEDIALITLRTGITAFEPLQVHREDVRGKVGDDVIAIGYGQTPSGSSGTKYITTGRVRYIDGNVLYTGPITCQGDSGGPIIDAASGEIIALTSFGSGACGAGGLAGAQRVDVFLDMIDTAVGDSGSCLNDGAERCDGYDNDCNGEIDEVCLPLGSECLADDECLGTNCADTPAGRRCTVACDPLRPELSCESGLYCARTAGCDGLCVPLPAESSASGGEGADCTADLDCMSLYCADPGDGRTRCLTPCRGGDGACFASEVCAATAGSCGGCVAAEIVRGARGLGEPCDGDEACASGSCFEEAGLAYCTTSCEMDSECGSGDLFHCRAGECVRGSIAGIGGACVENGDCLGDTFCAARAGVHWCTTFCSEDNACPEGFDCADVGDASLCVPVAGVVGDVCVEPADCISGICNEDGVCTRECGVDSPCSGAFECTRSEDGTAATCVAPPPPPIPEGGCSATGLDAEPPVLALFLAMFGLGALRRRSR